MSKIREPARRQAEPRSRNDWPCGSRDIHDLSAWACRGAAKLMLPLPPLPPLPPFPSRDVVVYEEGPDEHAHAHAHV